MADVAEGGRGPVILVGAGQMGGALLDAWLDADVAAGRLAVVEPRPSPALTDRLAHKEVPLIGAGHDAVSAEILVFAVKPQVALEAARSVQALVGPSTMVVSVVAGKTLADLRRLFPAAATIVRAMPNTPAAVRRSITGATSEGGSTAAQRAAADALLGVVGRVEWLADEAAMNAVTAVSGSGPAYVFFVVECLAQAGVDLGLDPAVAMRLARATVEGAGALLAARPDEEPGTLRRNVTSPGGTTAAALDVLMRENGLQMLVSAAAKAASLRAGELSG